MNRCRKCNTELTEQARFCNICGSPQTPAGPQVKVSTSTKQVTPVKTHRCHKCEAELPPAASFCNVCGSAQSSKAPSTTAIPSEKQATLSSADVDNKNLSGSTQSPKSLIPTRSIHPGSKEPSLSQDVGNNSIRPKTITRSPVYPPRPTNNGVKSPAALPQRDTLQSAHSPEIATSTIPLNSSSPANAPAVPEPTRQPDTSKPINTSTASSSAKAESISNTPTQSLEEPSSPERTSGLIRPITPKSPVRSVIPSRPDTQGTTTSTQQSNKTPAPPGYSLPVPLAKVSQPAKPQTQQRSSFSQTLPDTHSQENKQNAVPAPPQGSLPIRASGDLAQRDQQEQIAHNQITPVAPLARQMSSLHDFDELPTSTLSTEHINGQNGLADTPTMSLLSPESFIATSKAAEHWRKSWRDQQYAEAGSAENASRGQASVPMPLMAKQQSFARMRAIASNNKQQQKRRTLNFGTWIMIFLMICLIAGLGAYIIWSYLPNSPFGITHTTPPVNATQPSLTVQGTTSQTVIMGQTIQLHGEHFGANHAITFLLDMATPIADASGKNISSQTNSRGTFDATLSIDHHWTTGSHSIEAVDNSSNLNAFMTLQVIPAGTPTTSSTELSVTMDNNKAVKMLTFQAVIGQTNPQAQPITITNKSRAPLNWSAAASSSNNLSWLTINDNNTFGHLDISQPHEILISVNIVGLKSTLPQKPYTGQIVFTIDNNQLLTVPVQLEISDATPEMVFSPSPIIAQKGPGNTCNPGVTLTLINLGTVAVSWTVKPDDNIKGNIKFVYNGQPLESGTLLPSGQPGDSIVLTLQCINVGRQSYHVSVYANQMPGSDYVIVQ